MQHLASGECEQVGRRRVKVLAVGYSAGANVALHVGAKFGSEDFLAGMISVSPPFGWLGNMFLVPFCAGA